MLAGLGIVLLALVYLLRPGWIGLQSTEAPDNGAPPTASSEVTPGPSQPSAPPLMVGAGGTPPNAAPGSLSGSAPAPMTTTQETAPAAPKAPLRLVIAPSARCWVQVSADGQMRVAREVSPGERLEVDAAERLQIVVGDAGSFAYELNGRPGKALGTAGQVARATILPSTVPQFQTP